MLLCNGVGSARVVQPWFFDALIDIFSGGDISILFGHETEAEPDFGVRFRQMHRVHRLQEKIPGLASFAWLCMNASEGMLSGERLFGEIVGALGDIEGLLTDLLR